MIVLGKEGCAESRRVYRLEQAVDTVNTAHNILELLPSTGSELAVPSKPVNLCGFRCFRLQSQKQKEFLRPFFFFPSDLCVLCADSPQSCSVSEEGRRNVEGVGWASEEIPILSMVWIR